ncbi:MAG TPA: hypothetical protein VFL16_15105 [Steroidobacteraceae bacterium]|nr:hypothetical protein [Steroidobacteraceae bacterium]
MPSEPRGMGRWPLCALAVVPTTLAVLGGFVDERSRLGFSQWRSACRASGLTLESLLGFTLQLLPTAVLGALLGGLVVLGAGILLRRRGCAAGALGAHAACAIGMIVGLLLCVLPLPVPLLLTGEMTLTVALALFLRRFLAAPRLASAQ